MKIEFKAKPQTVHDMDGTALYQFVVVPELKRSHVDMHAARMHPKFGGLANSDLFPGVLARIRRDVLNGAAYLRLDALPANIIVDTSAFLAKVTIDVA